MFVNALKTSGQQIVVARILFEPGHFTGLLPADRTTCFEDPPECWDLESMYQAFKQQHANVDGLGDADGGSEPQPLGRTRSASFVMSEWECERCLMANSASDAMCLVCRAKRFGLAMTAAVGAAIGYL